jgi:hypothetical protein
MAYIFISLKTRELLQSLFKDDNNLNQEKELQISKARFGRLTYLRIALLKDTELL